MTPAGSGSSDGPGIEPGPPEPFAPFDVTASEQIYDSRWVGLRRDTLALEGGATQEHHVVEIGDAVCVLPLRGDGRVVMIGQYRHPHGKTHWELPAGRLEDGESPEDGARRELREETGHTAGRLVPLPGFYPINGISPHWCHLFAALECTRTGAQELDATERIVVTSFRPDEITALLRSGRIEDGFSALALLYGRLLLDR